MKFFIRAAERKAALPHSGSRCLFLVHGVLVIYFVVRLEKLNKKHSRKFHSKKSKILVIPIAESDFLRLSRSSK